MTLYRIEDVKKKYPNWFSADSELTYDEQKWIWENSLLPEGNNKGLEQVGKQDSTSISLIRSVSGIRNLKENVNENRQKNEAIKDLQDYTYKTPLKFIAIKLETIFGIWDKKPFHWIYIAENYTPKAINSVLREMRKRKENGGMPLEIPGAYFTKVLTKYHSKRKLPKRKEIAYTNGGIKQQNNE
ncbi:hypothetical protein A2422_04285 [Candidatus Woesebacteria bacterium RIFOXYC1_FULL_31_51]|uniref:Uncharacterized protein n=1 Tax=Candidatus Woesebacteria bacterium GW2011_GWC2_31_9 TaxID=1618586 RepID=A0A0F9YIV1_9BACT|nr:MAG: hypothetical protein UR17_C0001G0615 [Candidatus Woesebacteria bacterium GW2011_GWF1_31_35]KKP22771.1 MAG: hypothetical protein UR11_C0002G0151 [Candidatus Woesebacteria bacterium GW2011_GWC1_30_29]KKP26741.1 MAG: hypothetical protein UR13_C0003G0108 [Candidatus Woesebacteria bacterium GW2011_GWD1_31_12]KKP28019.1 MAG: hypothetical protein UR16_C0001G0040 [Candidatus Woesebacteria bacterium GW2011_GWB1_31_29]KKP31439.1 MAG: hypothetical protein UR21_C0009G0020 [Candidatus Woesebacteria 